MGGDSAKVGVVGVDGIVRCVPLELPSAILSEAKKENRKEGFFFH